MSFTGIPVEVDDWHGWRRLGIGASDVAGILGLSAWTTPFELHHRKRGLLPEEDETERMAWGKVLEDVIADEYGRRNDVRVIGRQLCVEHPAERWARATLDGVIVEALHPVEAIEGLDALEYGPIVRTPEELRDLLVGRNPLAIFEAKVVGQRRPWDEVPDAYYCQAQWQMFVTGLDRAVIVALHGGQRLEAYEVARDDGVLTDLVAACRDFYEDLLAERPPPVDSHEATRRALAALYPESTEEEVELDGDLVRELRHRKAAAKDAADRLALVEAKVKAALGDAAVGTVEGRPAVTWRTTKPRRTVDLDGLRASHPDLVEAFTVEGKPSRRFTVLKGAA